MYPKTRAHVNARLGGSETEEEGGNRSVEGGATRHEIAMSEIRNKFKTGNPKVLNQREPQCFWVFVICSLEFVSDFVFVISDFTGSEPCSS